MFRNIGRVGHLLTFEHNAWRTTYTTVYVPASLVTLQLDKYGIVISSIDNVWMSHHDTHEESKKVFHEVLACIHPTHGRTDTSTSTSTSTGRNDMPSPDSWAIHALK